MWRFARANICRQFSSVLSTTAEISSVGLRRLDGDALVLGTVESEEGLRDDILSLGDAAEHPIGNRKDQGPEPQKIGGPSSVGGIVGHLPDKTKWPSGL
jgi:hypothetical protein